VRKLKKAGMKSSDTAQLHFDNVRVPQRFRIGEEGMGFSYQMQQFQEERLWAAAGWRKNSEIIQETIAYLRERQAFGKPLLENQYIYFKLAELQTEVEAVSQGGGAVRGGQRRDAAGFDVQAEVRAPGPRSH
jgi:citronellyl-CoA dehydrogenase